MVEFKFHCAMPMFVARQWIRHRTASVNEYSGRYSLMPLLFYTPPEEFFALQSPTNAQGRGEQAAGELYAEACRRWDRIRSDAGEAYGWMVQEDVAREIARIDLPLSTYTQWYWKIDLHNLLHFLSLRVDPHAQWEIRAYAEVMAGIVKRVAPLSYEAWVDFDLLGSPMSRGELLALSRLLVADEEGVRARSSEALSSDDLKELGLSPREVREFAEKLKPRERPDFELDLGRMRPADEVAREMAQAVPSFEAAPPEG
jgi:thymidylate synthase (FAD)